MLHIEIARGLVFTGGRRSPAERQDSGDAQRRHLAPLPALRPRRARTGTALLPPGTASAPSPPGACTGIGSCLQPAFLDGRPARPSMEGRAASGGACRASAIDVILFYRILKVLMRAVFNVY